MATKDMTKEKHRAGRAGKTNIDDEQIEDVAYSVSGEIESEDSDSHFAADDWNSNRYYDDVDDEVGVEDDDEVEDDDDDDDDTSYDGIDFDEDLLRDKVKTDREPEPGSGLELYMKPGDAVLYMGAEVLHGRLPLEPHLAPCLQLVIGFRDISPANCNSQ